MNAYTTLNIAKADLGLTATTDDTMILRYCESVSRAIDRYCQRHFYTETATHYLEPDYSSSVVLDDDILSISAMTSDSEADGTFDGETWTTSDYNLAPYNGWPKLWIEKTSYGSYSFHTGARTLKITGEWGYGDGRSATPWDTIVATGTLSDATDTSLTLSADDGVVQAGHTLLIESEQMYVTAVSGVTVTVERGVNGTTAAAHASKAVAIAQYPMDVSRFAAWFVAYEYKGRDKAGMQQENIGGDYFYGRMANDLPKHMATILGSYRRGVI